ncbi:DUF397 domain-containing protein [Streptomyces sp. NBC_00047]|uniref:DUF397 domain-containing protein n=1 Tax=Streptomyces sp. NBC_00047 TaxID=2975627 RepID=UPI00224E05E3|nr:DUF397 domain-containing protein [Streptomyces sp. NBC_00047]MCX5607323.1 DUF397 domain-containing protein [Streptomyces sp. NBC_00047]
MPAIVSAPRTTPPRPAPGARRPGHHAPGAGEGGECVEVANCATQVRVRDSEVTDGPELDLTPAAWAALTEWTGSAN